MPVSLGLIGIEAADHWLLDAVLNTGQDEVSIAGFWLPPDSGTGEADGRLQILVHHGSLDDLIEASDCLYVAAPVAQRLDLLRHIAARNRAALCEKPLSDDPTKTWDFVRQLRNAPIAVNYLTPSVPAMGHLQNLIKIGALGAPSYLSIEFDRHDLPDPERACNFGTDLLQHHLFIALRLLGLLRLRDTGPLVPYRPTHEELAFRAGSIVATLSSHGVDSNPPHEAIWTLRGIGAIRLRGWSTLERAAPSNRWLPEGLDLSTYQVRTLGAMRQLTELAALALGRPNHLASSFEAYELEAFIALLRQQVARASGGAPGVGAAFTENAYEAGQRDQA